MDNADKLHFAEQHRTLSLDKDPTDKIFSDDGPSLAAALAAEPSQIYAVWRYFDNQIYWQVFDDLTNLWGQIGQPIQGPNSTTDHRPSLTGTTWDKATPLGGVLVAAWKGMGGDQHMYYATLQPGAPNETAFSSPPSVIPAFSDGTPAGSSHGPWLTFDPENNMLFAAWKGAYNDQNLWWAYYDGTRWSEQKSIGNFTTGTSHGPALAVFNGDLFAAWKGEGGDQSVWYSHIRISDALKGYNDWDLQRTIGGIGSSEGPSLVVYKERLYAFWKGSNGFLSEDDGIWYTFRDGANIFNTWREQVLSGGSGSHIGPTAAVTEPGNIILGWRGGNSDTALWWRLAAWPGQPITPSNS